MKIDWLKYRDNHVLGWTLLHAMSEHEAKDLACFQPFDSSSLRVVLTVNEVEIDFVEAMEYLQSQLSNMEKQAKKQGADSAKDDVYYDLCNKIGGMLGREAEY